MPVQPDPLSPFERRALEFIRKTNESRLGQSLQEFWIDKPLYNFAFHAIAKRTYIHGLDRYQDFDPDRGVLLASNHRSFFDQWPLLLSLWGMPNRWVKRIRFPVRANYFYERPTGVLVNLVMGGGSMYPPVFRDPAKAELNRETLTTLTSMLQAPGTIVGVHPEGRRNKGPDPYSLLPAQPGIGEMALKGRPIVVPAFVNGMTNDFWHTISASRKRDSRTREPVIMVFGPPIDYSEFTEKKPRAALYKRCADKIQAHIADLGQTERELRARCMAGEISDDDPGWMS